MHDIGALECSLQGVKCSNQKCDSNLQNVLQKRAHETIIAREKQTQISNYIYGLEY